VSDTAPQPGKGKEMADETSTSGTEGPEKSFSKGLAGAVAKKALVPVAATAATYLTRKASELWRDKVLPAVQERGGGRAVLKTALEKAAARTGGSASAMLSDLAGRLAEGSSESSPQSEKSETVEDPQASEARETERKERRQRRQQRQRALEKSGKS
jgi:hypothetical protein